MSSMCAMQQRCEHLLSNNILFLIVIKHLLQSVNQTCLLACSACPGRYNVCMAAECTWERANAKRYEFDLATAFQVATVMPHDISVGSVVNPFLISTFMKRPIYPPLLTCMFPPLGTSGHTARQRCSWANVFLDMRSRPLLLFAPYGCRERICVLPRWTLNYTWTPQPAVRRDVHIARKPRQNAQRSVLMKRQTQLLMH